MEYKMITGADAVIVSVVFSGIALLFTILRCISRFIVLRSPRSDDYVAILAMLGSLALAGLLLAQLHYGLGQSLFSLGLPNMKHFLAIFWSSIIAYAVGMVALKCSAILQYLRFVQPGPMRWFCWFMMVFNLAFGLVAIFVDIFQCRPVRFFWDRTIPGGSCLTLTKFWYAASGVHIVTDWAVLAIPVLLFKDMNLPRREKVALILVFMTAGLGCVVAIVRVYSVYTLTEPPLDVSKNSTLIAILSSLEMNLGIIGICTPPLKPIVQRFVPSLLFKRAPKGLSQSSSATVVQEMDNSSDTPTICSKAGTASWNIEAKMAPQLSMRRISSNFNEPGDNV